MNTVTKVIDITTSENSEKEELIKRTPIEESPFYVITTKDGSFGVIGEYRITEIMSEPEDVTNYFEKITWDKISTLILILIDKFNKSTNEN